MADGSGRGQVICVVLKHLEASRRKRRTSEARRSWDKSKVLSKSQRWEGGEASQLPMRRPQREPSFNREN